MSFLKRYCGLLLVLVLHAPAASAAECIKADYQVVDGRYFVRQEDKLRVCFNPKTQVIAMRATEATCPAGYRPDTWENLWRISATGPATGGCVASVQFVLAPGAAMPERAVVLMRTWPLN